MSILEKFGVIGYEDHKDTFTEELGDPNIDPVEALEAVGEAMVETAIAETDLEVLEASYEALTEHAELMADLAAKRPDDKVATIVAYESFRINLKMLGADPDKMTSPAGYEDINAGYESVKETADKVWNALKKAAKKLWEAIVRFVGKVVDFVMGLFGKREVTGEKLEKMLEKLKEEGKTKLPDDAKFEEGTAKTLAEHNVIAYTLGGGTDANNIVKYLDSIKGISTAISKNIDVITKATKEVSAAVKNKNTEELGKALENFANKIIDGIHDTDKNTPDAIKKIGKELAGPEFSKCEGELYVSTVSVRSDSIALMVTCLPKGYLDVFKKVFVNLNDAKPEDAKDLMETFNKLTAAVKIKTIKVDRFSEELKPYVEKLVKEVKPFRFDESEKIAKTLKEAAADRAKELKKVKENANTLKNEVNVMLDAFAEDANKEAGVGTKIAIFVLKHLIRFGLNIAIKQMITGYAELSADLAKSKIGMIVNESTKLYVKEGEEKKEEK